MTDFPRQRLAEERRQWRKDYPPGFVARPKKNPQDGSQNLLEWDCVVPGKAGTIWEGAKLRVSMDFRDNYPINPPIVKFDPVLWHLNVWSSGRVCLSILNQEDGTWHGKWRSTITVKQILLGVQEVIANPYPAGARPDVQGLYKKDLAAYEKRLKEEADKYKS